MSSPPPLPSGDAPPPKRTHTGATGSSIVFEAPRRVESFARKLTRSKNKKKLKSASVPCYRLDSDEKRVELEDWLVKRFGMGKAELKLELKRDFYVFKIPEQDVLTEHDLKAVEDMRD